MASLNKVMLIGNVGDEPKVHPTATKVVSFSLATTKKGFTRKDGTKVEDKTEWHNLTVFGNLASIVESYVHKGSQIYVEGELQTQSYTDVNNVKKYVTRIIVDNLQLLDRKPQGGDPSSADTATQPAGGRSFARTSGTSDDGDMPF